MCKTCVLAANSCGITPKVPHKLSTTRSLKNNDMLISPCFPHSFTNSYTQIVHINYSLIQSVISYLSTVSTYLTITVTNLIFKKTINNNVARLCI